MRIILIVLLVAILAIAGWFFFVRADTPDDSLQPSLTGTPAAAATATLDPAVGAMINFRPPSTTAPRATPGSGGFMIPRAGPGAGGRVATPEAYLTAYAYMTQMNNAIGTQVAAVATINAGGGVATARPGSGSSASSARASTVPRDVWLGSYYAGLKSTGKALMVRRDAVIDHNWGGGSPGPGLPADAFSIKWQRLFKGDGGVYRIRAVTDDGLRIKLDGKVIMEGWSDGPKDLSADFGMAARDYQIQVEYFENRGDARAKVWIERPSDPKFPDWKAEYYNNITLSGSPALIRNETAPKLSFGTKGPDLAIDGGYFSARFTKEVDFDKGSYEFSVRADDGVRVWVDGDLLINEWHGSDGKTVYKEEQTLNGDKDVRIEFYNSFDKGLINVSWKKMSASGSDATHTPGPTDTGTPAPPSATVPSPTTGPTRTPTQTPRPSDTPTATAVDTPTPTETPEPPTDTPTPMPTDTETPAPTNTP